jgi:hypothetical protein
VRPGVAPSTGWGSVTAASIGIVTSVPTSGNITIKFPEQGGWVGVASEMEVIRTGAAAGGDQVIVSGAGYAPSNGTYVKQPASADQFGHAVYAKEGEPSRIIRYVLMSGGFGHEGWIVDQPGPAPYKLVGGPSDHDFVAGGHWETFQGTIGAPPMPTVVCAPVAAAAAAAAPSADAPRFSVGAYALKAGNDCPERDPASWRLLGMNPAGAWVELHSVASAAFPERYGWLAYTVESSELCSALKFEFALAAGTSGMMQLGQISVYQRLPAPGRDAAGHELVAAPAAGAPTGSGWVCNVCGATFPGAIRHTSCVACAYELCSACRLLGRGGVRVPLRAGPVCVCVCE